MTAQIIQFAPHSPAPWSVEDDGSSFVKLTDCDGETIDRLPISRYVDERDDPTQDANIRLIAAAPQLLALLRDLVGGDCSPANIMRRARPLIARIDGGLS